MARLTAGLAALLLAAACKDDVRGAAADPDLARDITLAGQVATTLTEFRDSAIAPAPAPSAPAPARPSPRPAPRPAPRTNPTPAPPPREPSRVEDPAPVERPAPVRFRGIGAGISFGITTRAAICTSNLPGDKITATLSSTVVGDNGATLPEGTIVVLEVASVTPGDTPDNAQIALRVRSVLLGDDALDFPSEVAIMSELERGPVAGSSGSDTKKVIGGAIAGAVLGQILGRDTKSTVIGAAAGAAAGTAAAAATRRYHACLPAGGTARVTTSQPISVSD